MKRDEPTPTHPFCYIRLSFSQGAVVSQGAALHPLRKLFEKSFPRPFKNFKRNGFSKFFVALLTAFSLQPSTIFPLRLPFGHPPLPKGEAFIISISFVGSPLGRAGAVRRLRGSPLPPTFPFAPRATVSQGASPHPAQGLFEKSP